MLERICGNDELLATTWNDMGVGAPTLIAFAQLCSRAMIGGATTGEFSPEAKAILYAARDRGILEVKASNTAYESPSRLLTVFVELDDDTKIRFRDNRDPRQNVRFLDGFRQLCVAGLVMHHLYHEFSLTSAGFDLATTIEAREVEKLLDFGQECGPG